MTCLEYPKTDTLFTRDDNHVITNVIRRPEFLVPAKWLATEKINGTNIRISLEQESCAHAGLDHPGAGLTGTCDTPWVMVIRGRTSRAQIPTLLFEHLQKTFIVEGLKSLWRGKSNCNRCDGTGREDSGQPKWLSEVAEPFPYACDCVEPYPITLYGEGYGGGIQKGGGQYTSKTKGGKASFRLFDVFIGETWLDRENVLDIAGKLGIGAVPLLRSEASIDELVQMVREGFGSTVADEEGTLGHPAEGIMAFTSPPLFNSRGRRLIWKLKTKDFK